MCRTHQDCQDWSLWMLSYSLWELSDSCWELSSSQWLLCDSWWVLRSQPGVAEMELIFFGSQTLMSVCRKWSISVVQGLERLYSVSGTCLACG